MSMQVPDRPLLSISDLVVSFWSRGRQLQVLNGVSFSVGKGEIVGVLGESGSGKSVTASAIMGLIDTPGTIDSGSIAFEGTELTGLARHDHRRLCGVHLAMVFQDALAALNPVFTVGSQIAEMFVMHKGMGRSEAHGRAIALMERVGIPDARARADQFPHQFSGGMRQRVVIAMAVALAPELIIADEPTTALDVSVQAQIIDLLQTIRDESQSAIVLITHDLGVIAECADRVVVMYAGRVVEQATVSSIFERPAHPYSEGLLNSRPTMDCAREGLVAIAGSPPDPAFALPGCAFSPRCPYVMERCSVERPELRPVRGSLAACHLDGPLGGGSDGR